MITHKDALEILDIGDGDFDYKKISLEDINALRELIKSEMWHKYPNEKPEIEQPYLVYFGDKEYGLSMYLESKGFIDEMEVVAWRNIADYEEV